MRGPAEALTPAAGAVLRPVRSPWALAWDQFRRHRPAMAGLVVLALLVAVTLVGSQTYPRRIDEIDFGRAMAPPSTQFPMGTDDLGRDILARVLWGGRISLAVGLAAMVIAVVLGTAVGAVSGFFGGIADGLLMRVTDLFISMPQLPLLLLLIYLFRDPLRARFGPEVGIFLLIVGVIGGFNWMSTARLVRAAFLSVKQKEFIEAARCIGAPTHRLILAHILPNVLSPVIVAATLGVGQAIIAESALSFLGLGFPPDIPTWGRMLFDAKDFLDFAPHMALFPGLMIFTTVLAINYVGDGLRDALDPHQLR